MTATPRDEGSPAGARGGWHGVLVAWRANPHWRRLYVARSISLLGNWFNSLVLVELIAGPGTGNAGVKGALALAVVFVLKQLPTTILTPAAGVVADRFDRKRIMIVCELLATAIVLHFLLLTPGKAALWVYLLTALQMGASAFFLPAYRALVPALVREQDLAAANVASSATWSIMFALGMALGGLVLELFGWQVAIVIDAVSYAVSAALVISIRWRAPKREPSPATGLFRLFGIRDMVEGLRYIRGDRNVSRIILVKFGWGSMGAITLFLALLGRTDYQFGDKLSNGVSYLWGCRALGTLFGPMIAYRFGGDDPKRLEQTITCAYFLAPLLYVAFALTHNFWVGGLIVFTAHLGGSTLWVISTVLLQKVVPDEFRGRTFAAELGLVMLSSSLSHLVYGAVIDLGLLDVRTTILVAALLCLAPAVLWFGARRRS